MKNVKFICSLSSVSFKSVCFLEKSEIRPIFYLMVKCYQICMSLKRTEILNLYFGIAVSVLISNLLNVLPMENCCLKPVCPVFGKAKMCRLTLLRMRLGKCTLRPNNFCAEISVMVAGLKSVRSIFKFPAKIPG